MKASKLPDTQRCTFDMLQQTINAPNLTNVVTNYRIGTHSELPGAIWLTIEIRNDCYAHYLINSDGRIISYHFSEISFEYPNE